MFLLLFSCRRMSRLLFNRGLPLSTGLALLALFAATPQTHAQTTRLAAPEFDGAVGPTLGSDKPIKLKDLRGKIVVLEFWTLC